MKTLSQRTFSSASHKLMKVNRLYFFLFVCFGLGFFVLILFSFLKIKSYFALSKHSSIECVINATASLGKR